MRVGTSLFLVAVGLILVYATDFELPGLDVRSLGSILFFVGLLGLLLTVGMEVAARRAHRPPTVRPRRPRAPEPPARSERPYDPVIAPRRSASRPGEEPTRVLGDETRRLPPR